MRMFVIMATIKKAGYLYVLVNPRLPNYFKLGQTTKHPTERLKDHNSNKNRILGKIAQITKSPWQLLYYVPVTNARKAESATLWNDILPRWDNLELYKGDIIPVVEDIIKSPYLDLERYHTVLATELIHYDYKSILTILEKDWGNEHLSLEADRIVQEVKKEREANDKRHVSGSWLE